MPGTLPVKEWLENVRAGFGEIYTKAFTELGYDFVGDVVGMTTDEMTELEEALKEIGVKKPHLRIIRNAIAEEGAKAEKGVAPPNRPAVSAPSATGSPLKNRLLTKADNNYAGGKQYACFLSHHKEACAMEARFLKGWYRW